MRGLEKGRGSVSPGCSAEVQQPAMTGRTRQLVLHRRGARCTAVGLVALPRGSPQRRGALCTAVGLCTTWVSRRRRTEAG